MRWHSGIDILRLLTNSHMRFAFVGVEIRALPLVNDNRPATRKTTPSYLSLPFASLQHCKQPPNSILPAYATRMTRKHAEGRFLLETASCLPLIEPLCIADLTLLVSPNRNSCFWPSYDSFTLKKLVKCYKQKWLNFHVPGSIIILKLSNCEHEKSVAINTYRFLYPSLVLCQRKISSVGYL